MNTNANGHIKMADLDDLKSKVTTPTPQPIYVCAECDNGPALIGKLCEPCYRTLHIKPKQAALDKLYHQVSEVTMSLAKAEGELNNCKVAYNKAIKQNWTCALGCGMTFSYYGDLFEHEATKSCKKLPVRRSKYDRYPVERY